MSSYKWPPLESDPEIFTEYFEKMGLPENIRFNELYTIDYKEVQPIDGEVLSVIINYENNPSNLLHRNPDNFKSSENFPFYMKQKEDLDYACGLIAGLHSIGNNLNKINLIPTMALSNYYENATNKTPEERAKILCEDNSMKNAHISHAVMGQSNLPENPEEVKNHFVSFNYVNGSIYEFDGMMQGVYLIKSNVPQENFFDDTLAEISSRLTNQNITENLSIIFMSKL
jgi:ubiquitin carboxyl-terminal hydrolase L3